MQVPLDIPSSPAELCQVPLPGQGAMPQDMGANSCLLHRFWCPQVKGKLLLPPSLAEVQLCPGDVPVLGLCFPTASLILWPKPGTGEDMEPAVNSTGAALHGQTRC